MQAFGIFLIIFGLLMLFRPAIEMFIKFNNTIRGVETKISGGTLIAYRISSIAFILIGIYMLMS